MDTSGKSAVKFLMKNILAKPADLKFLYVKKKNFFFKEQHQRFEDFFSLMSRFCSQEIVWVLSTSFFSQTQSPGPCSYLCQTYYCYLLSSFLAMVVDGHDQNKECGEAGGGVKGGRAMRLRYALKGIVSRDFRDLQMIG